MKLIKLSEEHYIVVDDSEIKEGDWYWNELDAVIRKNNTINRSYHKKITHSTLPVEYDGDNTYTFDKVKYISLSYIKELIGYVDVEKKSDIANGYAYYGKPNGEKYLAFKEGFMEGYNQAIEDNKDKLYTEEQMLRMFMSGHGLKSAIEMKMIEDKPVGDIFKELLERYNPKPEWYVELVDGKLKLK